MTKLHPDAIRARLEPLFDDNFASRGELGAAVSIWQNGVNVVHLYGGFRDVHKQQPWTADTMVLFWSATKGLGSACVLHAMQERKIDIAERVARFWPEFAQADKADITIAQLLSHQAGLSALDEEVDVLDYAAVIAALEKQKPLWPPGTAHGYHARTFGFLLDELLRRISGTSLSEYWRQHFGDPMQLDIWIGLPAAENTRVATIYAAKAGGAQRPESFYRDLTTPGTLVRKTFTSPRGLHSVSAMNGPQIREKPFVSFGGIGNANALGKFYAMLANGGQMEGREYFDAKTITRWMATTLTEGIDLTLQMPTAFSAGFLKDPVDAHSKLFGPSSSAFGHPGAGGSHAFGDPENGIAFAYLMNQMEQSLFPDEKSLRLVQAIYR